MHFVVVVDPQFVVVSWLLVEGVLLPQVLHSSWLDVRADRNRCVITTCTNCCRFLRHNHPKRARRILYVQHPSRRKIRSYIRYFIFPDVNSLIITFNANWSYTGGENNYSAHFKVIVRMVDPNRKINRLSDDDAVFLSECEQEFHNRFSVDDNEFTTFCAKPTRPPPIISPWQSGGNRYNNQNQWRNNRGGGYHNNRNNINQQHNRNRGNEFVHRGPRHQQNNRNPYDRNRRHDRNHQRPNNGGGSYEGGGGSGSGASYQDRLYNQRPSK